MQDISPTILALPSLDEITLSRTDPLVQADIEQCSPASLRRAVDRVYSTSQGLTKEKLLQLTLAARFMKLLYPFEAVDWNVPSYRQSNQYLDALLQIEKGHYPQMLGINTFLDAVIPAIILTRGTGAKEYGAALENRLFTARKLNPDSVLPFYLLGLLYEQLNHIKQRNLNHEQP